MRKHPGKSVEDCVDFVINSSKIHTYRDIEWRTLNELSTKLGETSASNIYRWVKLHPGKIHEYIDKVLDRPKRKGSYRGIEWKDYRDLSKKLGKSQTYVGVWVNRNPDKSLTDLIDQILGEKESH